VGLLVFALAFFIGANSPLKSQLAELQSSLEQAQRPRENARAAPSPRAEMQAFMSRLPVRAELPVLTEKIVAAAAGAGIALERGTYDFTVTHSGRLVRARMTFPVHGRYPAIRRFVDQTLATIPGAAVDGLRLERKDIAAAEIDADIRFAIYLRSSP
jgi:Tfp pilus assembly protein PilO